VGLAETAPGAGLHNGIPGASTQEVALTDRGAALGGGKSKGQSNGGKFRDDREWEQKARRKKNHRKQVWEQKGHAQRRNSCNCSDTDRIFGRNLASGFGKFFERREKDHGLEKGGDNTRINDTPQATSLKNREEQRWEGMPGPGRKKLVKRREGYMPHAWVSAEIQSAGARPVCPNIEWKKKRERTGEKKKSFKVSGAVSSLKGKRGQVGRVGTKSEVSEASRTGESPKSYGCPVLGTNEGDSKVSTIS